MKNLRLGILGSTRGTDMLALIAAIKANTLQATIEIVISNKADAMILQHAEQYQLPHQFVNPTGLSRDQFDEQVSACLAQYHVDLVVLIGYMRILSNKFVTQWENKIINAHPSLLPAFAGEMDNNIHQAVLDAKMTETGCTVHYVTTEVDAGPILKQKTCAILPDDTVERLKSRVQHLEGLALIEVINELGQC